MFTITMTQAAIMGLVIQEDVDPHDFAPYCEHDPYSVINGMTEPLFACGPCDEQDERQAVADAHLLAAAIISSNLDDEHRLAARKLVAQYDRGVLTGPEYYSWLLPIYAKIPA